ncbi:hypothetical protein MTO96_014418 [Rhipicephalus appendiculatus]
MQHPALEASTGTPRLPLEGWLCSLATFPRTSESDDSGFRVALENNELAGSACCVGCEGDSEATALLGLEAGGEGIFTVPEATLAFRNQPSLTAPTPARRSLLERSSCVLCVPVVPSGRNVTRGVTTAPQVGRLPEERCLGMYRGPKRGSLVHGIPV